jgi:hypothetical protein
MKGLIVVMLGTFAIGCGSSSSGGGDPQAVCKEGTQALCDKVYDCAEGEPYRSFFGATKADCIATVNADSCATTTGCDTGQTYHGDQAQACVSAFKAISCAQLNDTAAIAPASCDMVCTGP